MTKAEFNKEVGKYLLDISKLVFGGVVLASVIKIENISKIWILLIGTLVSGVIVYFGFKILKNQK